jgi:hypothetical protein
MVRTRMLWDSESRSWGGALALSTAPAGLRPGPLSVVLDPLLTPPQAGARPAPPPGRASIDRAWAIASSRPSSGFRSPRAAAGGSSTSSRYASAAGTSTRSTSPPAPEQDVAAEVDPPRRLDEQRPVGAETSSSWREAWKRRRRQTAHSAPAPSLASARHGARPRRGRLREDHGQDVEPQGRGRVRGVRNPTCGVPCICHRERPRSVTTRPRNCHRGGHEVCRSACLRLSLSQPGRSG